MISDSHLPRRMFLTRTGCAAGIFSLALLSQSGCAVMNLLLKAPQDEEDYSNINIEKLNNIKECKKIGKALIESRKPITARKVLHKALSFNPNDHEANNYLGRAYFLSGDNEKAKLFIKTAIALKENYAEAYYNLGDVYFKEGNLDIAMKNYKTAIDINPAFKERIRHFFGEDFRPLE